MRLTLEKASRRNTQCHWVGFQDVDVLFSYQTPIAFRSRGVRWRRHNDWGPTTGRHMKDADVKDWAEYSEEDFNTRLSNALVNGIRDKVAEVLAA